MFNCRSFLGACATARSLCADQVSACARTIEAATNCDTIQKLTCDIECQ